MASEKEAALAAVPNDNPTIFDKIIKKEIPSTVVFEDEKVLAFRDINPQAPTHIVIIPKVKDGLTGLSKAEERHVEILGYLLYVAKVVAKQEGLEDGYRIVINDGPSGSGDSLGEEVLRMFLAERQAHGDFVTKISDMVWRRNGGNLGVLEAAAEQENSADVAPPQPEEASNTENHPVVQDVMGEGMLRIAATRDWVSGESSLPVSKRLSAKERQDERERRKELNLLRYEALKDELLLLTTGIGAACSLYCLLVFSLEAAVSYAFGVAFSCLYLQLLYRHTDNLSKKDVPEIFMKKKVKRIGIRSEDLKNTIEKVLGGISVALSSPRLVIPAIFFGLSTLSDHFQNSILNFELVPGMMGFFAYKAAALVQVYRDNEDLRLILPEEDADSS
uniref:HIT domain-containing protein n=1 Tax=Oryza barthii TaxID=65489 RepID=A0A0D3FHW4_9ORYZ